MATVRMSRQVQDHIIESADKAFRITNPFHQFDVTLGDRLYNELYKPQTEELINKIRTLDYIRTEDVYDTQDHISIDLEGVDLDQYIDPSKESRAHYGRSTFYSDIDVPMSQKQKFFSTRGSENLSVPKNSPFHKEIVDKLEANGLIEEDLKNQIDKIQNVINICSTVNQFLKAWPAGSAHIPDDKLQKVNERSVRKQEAEQRRALVEGMEAELNTTILTSSLLED